MRPCETNEDCDDGVDCTTESCGSDGLCVYQADHSACDNADMCDGAELCVVDDGCQPGALPAPARECREDVDPAVALGAYHTCAVDPLGYAYCWGSGLYGQLGYGELGETANIGETNDRLPEQIGPLMAPNGGEAPLRYVTQLAAGTSHTCALLNTGAVLCWGYHDQGQLGYGVLGDRATDPDPERPKLAAPLDEPVNIGGNVTQISSSDSHTCALLDTGKVRCWGRGSGGALGYPTGEPGGGGVDPKLNVGDDETPAEVGDVDVGGNVVQISVGGQHTCVLLDDGNVRCWGTGDSGQLGYSSTDDVGDQETPATVGNIQLGGKAVQIAAGGSHTCALLESGAVRCWGRGNEGQLGYGTIDFAGDPLAGNELGETPAEIAAMYGDVNVGDTVPVIQIAAGGERTCALLEGGKVRCWGETMPGPLGYGNIERIGDNETPNSAGDVDLGGPAVKVIVGKFHVCAILEAGDLLCWGYNQAGQLGYGNENIIGDNETPANVGSVPLGVSLKP